jgi:hypothetical protein
MRIQGSCHCGNIRYDFDIPGAAKDLGVRACSCSFCVKHGGAWTSHRQGKLAAVVFYVCSGCGAVPFVTSDIESHLYAVVNVNTFDGIDPSSLARAPADFEGETSDARLARRSERWIPQVSIKN